MKNQNLTKIIVKFAALAVILLAAPGCTRHAKIGWSELPKANGQSKGTIYLDDVSYEGTETTVGRHTFTVFAIPTFGILTENQVSPTMTVAVKECLMSCGYTVKPASQANGKNVLKPSIPGFHYWSYMWLWPLMLEGGRIQLTMEMESPDGQTLWCEKINNRSFWATPVAGYGYDKHIKGDMDGLLEDLRETVLSEEFKKYIN